MSNLAKIIDSAGITLQVRQIVDAPPAEGWKHTTWKTTVLCGGRRLTVDYHMGSAHDGTEPQAPDVVASLILDTSGDFESFEAWCSDYGYETDDAEARKIFRTCKARAPKVRSLLGSHFDALRVASAAY